MVHLPSQDPRIPGSQDPNSSSPSNSSLALERTFRRSLLVSCSPSWRSSWLLLVVDVHLSQPKKRLKKHRYSLIVLGKKKIWENHHDLWGWLIPISVTRISPGTHDLILVVSLPPKKITMWHPFPKQENKMEKIETKQTSANTPGLAIASGELCPWVKNQTSRHTIPAT